MDRTEAVCERRSVRKAANRVELLALDIDGTILTSGKVLTPRTAAAITSAAQLGVHIVLVTDSNDNDGAAKAIERMILQTEKQ